MKKADFLFELLLDSVIIRVNDKNSQEYLRRFYFDKSWIMCRVANCDVSKGVKKEYGEVGSFISTLVKNILQFP